MVSKEFKNHRLEGLYEIPVQTIQGDWGTLAPFKGQVLLIVNVASRCGFTKQYQELECLYRQYKHQGLTVLGFPCTQFLNQEPGSNQTIHEFAKSCFYVTFPMFAKIDVKGAHQAPIYQYLQANIQKKPWWFIPWNFTKILVSRTGRVIEQRGPLTSKQGLEKAIIDLLQEV